MSKHTKSTSLCEVISQLSPYMVNLNKNWILMQQYVIQNRFYFSDESVNLYINFAPKIDMLKTDWTTFSNGCNFTALQQFEKPTPYKFSNNDFSDKKSHVITPNDPSFAIILPIHKMLSLLEIIKHILKTIINEHDDIFYASFAATMRILYNTADEACIFLFNLLNYSLQHIPDTQMKTC